MLKIIPLGGLGEIGLNMMVFEYKDSLFVVDAGLMFRKTTCWELMPPYRIWNICGKTNQKLAGIVLTHAHEDHIGRATVSLENSQCPCIRDAFTLGIVRHKLDEYVSCQNLLSMKFIPGKA